MILAVVDIPTRTSSSLPIGSPRNLNDDNIRIIESNEDPLLYPSGHIPGAVEVDWVKDLNDPLRRDYLDKSGFKALASRIGITPDTTVIFLRRQKQLVGDLRALGIRAISTTRMPR